MSGEFLKIRTNQIIWRKPSEKPENKIQIKMYYRIQIYKAKANIYKKN